METTNKSRADRAFRALKSYVEIKGEVFENSSCEITDLIADLLHLTIELDQGDDAIESTLRMARTHFEAEHGNPEEDGEQKQYTVSAKETYISEWTIWAASEKEARHSYLEGTFKSGDLSAREIISIGIKE